MPPLSDRLWGKVNVTDSVRRIADGVSAEWETVLGDVNKSRNPFSGRMQ